MKIIIWPLLVFVLVMVYRKDIKTLLGRLRKAGLPGGGLLDFEEEIEEAEFLSKKVKTIKRPKDKIDIPTIQITEANSRMIELGLKPVPSGLDMNYYREIADKNPNLALAGLRIEIEILAKNLALGFNVKIDKKDSGSRILRKLYDGNAITIEQSELTNRVWRICNEAVHGQNVSLSEALSVLEVVEILSLQYLDWLSWGFTDK